MVYNVFTQCFLFQHTAARRRLVPFNQYSRSQAWFQHTAARRRLGRPRRSPRRASRVSTHSRPKAAGCAVVVIDDCAVGFQHTAARRRLETRNRRRSLADYCFNTQPPEGGWDVALLELVEAAVSTHSRPKAAGHLFGDWRNFKRRFQHTAARRRLVKRADHLRLCRAVSTHSRPKAAGWLTSKTTPTPSFQHTAARRRLAIPPSIRDGLRQVSTHSRPKAAGIRHSLKLERGCKFQHTAARRRLVAAMMIFNFKDGSFNTQPPEGGWQNWNTLYNLIQSFQHTAARRRLAILNKPVSSARCWFQHTAARRRLVFKATSYKCRLMFQHTAARRRLDKRGYTTFIK